jgi:hypothetical protein
MDPTYPANKCLYCTQIETSDHIFKCQFTQLRCTFIFQQIVNQIDHNFPNYQTITTTILNQPETHPAILKGLIPSSWTQSCNTTTPKDITIKVIEIVNWLINAFRKTIWHEWCTQWKQWEKRQLSPQTQDPTATNSILATITNTPLTQSQTNQIIDQILRQKRKNQSLFATL